MQAGTDWQPTASLDALKLRATVLARLRRFFAARDVLEVDTPALSIAGTPDPALHSLQTCWHGPGALNGASFYLHTSPEFPMKRLLAAGTGSIFQVCKVFRDRESGRLHNPEFTLLEWYRTGFDQFDLMDEVEALLRAMLEGFLPVTAAVHWTYRDLFIETAGVDPFTATGGELESLLQSLGINPPAGLAADDRDGWLDMVLVHVVEPAMPAGLVFVRDYPASQAALARLCPGTPPVAARFEVYLNGIELANGFLELTDADEQRHRFVRENDCRQQQGDDAVTMDERLLTALQAGVPDCAGVALGIDRLLMIAGRYDSLDEVIAFPLEHA